MSLRETTRPADKATQASRTMRVSCQPKMEPKVGDAYPTGESVKQPKTSSTSRNVSPGDTRSHAAHRSVAPSDGTSPQNVEHASAAPRPAIVWSPRRRAVVSLLVLFHVAAVYVGALAVPPTSALGEALGQAFRPYVQAAYLDHGYRFFNVPGPSHLVRYRLEFSDGRPAVEGIFPNLEQHWPRLRYHRHFMLSEHLRAIEEVPSEPPPNSKPGDEIYEQWQLARRTIGQLEVKYQESYARHLLAAHGARRVTLWGRTRDFPSMEAVRNGMRPGDPRLVNDGLLGTWEANP